MIRRILSFCATAAVLLMAVPSAFAMMFVDAEKVMGASVDFGGNRRVVRGQTLMRVTDLDGTELVFVVHDEGSYKTNYVTVESPDGATVYCTLPAGMRFRVHEIDTEAPERRFWLARTGIGVSDDTCASFCLIGRYGDTYAPYVTREDLRQAGFIGHEIWWKVEDGELVITGWKRSRSEDMWRHSRNWDAQLDEVRLLWDDEAEWFGIRHDIPAIYETDNWFYTDEDGTNYYLRRIEGASDWIGAQVIREYADGATDSLLYRIENAPQCPYTICYGNSFSSSEVAECGLLYDDSDANPSAVTLFEDYLRSYSAFYGGAFAKLESLRHEKEG